jgi:succinate dehydrogenase / fumarate reductase cytochrome b subunit
MAAKDNDLGIKGWVYAGRYSLQRYAYTLQRVTGVGIILYLLIHLYVTAQKNAGEAAWANAMDAVRPLHIGEYFLFLAIVIHACNGFRLVWAEFGLGLGRPIKNVYPYQTCLDRNRVFFFVSMALVFILAVVGTADFFNLIRVL